MKKILIPIMLILLIVCCNVQKKFEPTFEANIKNHLDSNTGIFAIADKDKLYYFGNQNERRGIFCSTFDGKDSHILLECSDVRRMQIDGNYLYTLILDEGKKAVKTHPQSYQLIVYDLETGKSDIIKLFEYDYKTQYGTYDFYLCEQSLFFNDLSYYGSHQAFFLQTGLKYEEDYITELENLTQANRILSENINVVYYDMDYVWCVGSRDAMAPKPGVQDKVNYITIYSTLGVYDKEKGENIFGYRPGIHVDELNPRILNHYQNQIAIARGENLIIYDTGKQVIAAEYQFPDILAVKNAILLQEKVLLLCVTEDNQDCIYSIDRNTDEVQAILGYEENQRVLYFDADTYIVASGSVLERISYSGEKTVLWRTNLDREITGDTFKTDAAGSILFITELKKNQIQRELVYRINLEDGTVIE